MGIYVFRNNQVEGPFDELVIQQALANGTMSPGEQVCREGSEEWHSAGEMFSRPLKNGNLTAQSFSHGKANLISGIVVIALLVGYFEWHFADFFSALRKKSISPSLSKAVPALVSSPPPVRPEKVILGTGNAAAVVNSELPIQDKVQMSDMEYDEKLLEVASECGIISSSYKTWDKEKRAKIIKQLDGIGYGCQTVLGEKNRFVALRDMATMLDIKGPADIDKFEEMVVNAQVIKSKMDFNALDFVTIYARSRQTFIDSGSYSAMGASGVLKVMLAAAYSYEAEHPKKH